MKILKKQRRFVPVIPGKMKFYKVLGQDYFIPQRGTSYSAGYDLTSPAIFEIKPGEIVKIFTNVKAYMLDDEYLEIHIRSSIAIKKHLRLVNCVGIIDKDYAGNKNNDGNIIIALKNESTNTVSILDGERIAQGIFKKYLVVDNDVPLTDERIGGVGSTGKK